MPTLDRDGTSLHYESHGDGVPVLFSHGYGGTAEMWDRQVEALAGRCRLITWEMRGHARSDSPTDPAAYSEAAAVADMAALLDACDADDAVIAGLALGGYLSLAFRLAHPRRTRALVLVGTGPGYRNDAARDAWNATADSIADALDTDGLDALEKIAWGRHPLHRSAAGLALASRGMLRQEDGHIMESLPAVDVPTLVVVGARDTDFLVPSAYMARKIPDATLVEIADADHGCNMDAPEDFNRSLLDFLARVA
ncbi:MAG: alpha/beta hydrolase [Pseudonocardia sp. SCN 72-86]|nr:MAG: alpha/beta hydrolase [Pseudonocardia sp. SCN 72-86]